MDENANQLYDPNPAPSVPPGPRFSFNFPLILNIVLGVLVIALGVFAGMLFSKYNTAKTDVDGQKATAAQVASDEQKAEDEAAFVEREKEPYRTYQAPDVLGAISLQFPKTWNVYAIEQARSSTQLDVFMAPQFVHADSSTAKPYALRVRLQARLYTENVRSYRDKVKRGELKAQAVKVSGITGIRYEGKITTRYNGTLILLPLRDKTLYIWTESGDYQKDFEKILAKVKVSP